MKKSIFLILISCMSFCATRTAAQSVDALQVVIDSLSVKVVNLEQELAFLKINTEINDLDTEIRIRSIEVSNMLTNLHIGGSSVISEMREFYKAFERNIKYIKDEVDSLQERVSASEDSFSAFKSVSLLLKMAGLLQSYSSLEEYMSIIEDALY